MKSVLFITWDGPQTSYLEGLFFPVFEEIAKREEYEFHVLQFTWADESVITRISTAAAKHKCHYTPVIIKRGYNLTVGKLMAVSRGGRLVAKYITRHKIDMIMPRSTIPAMMVNLAAYRFRNVKKIFDADGFPNMERVDFGAYGKTGSIHRLREKAEIRILKKADVVLVRSARAIEIHLQNIGERFRPKFFVVTNGRDPQFFRPDPDIRRQVRERLGLNPETTLFIYCGSIGPQYLPDEMMEIFSGYKQRNPDAKFLILTGDTAKMEEFIPTRLRSDVIIMQVPFTQIPEYLSAGDMALALRKPTLSMQGVAPIKLGEYMMMGLPTIASTGIGDYETLLGGSPGAFLYDHANPERVCKAIDWCGSPPADRTEIRKFGAANFSLARSAESYIAALASL